MSSFRKIPTSALFKRENAYGLERKGFTNPVSRMCSEVDGQAKTAGLNEVEEKREREKSVWW